VGSRYKSSVGKTIDINSFCKKYDFDYDFDTLDDMVRIYSSNREIKLILNSVVGSINGKTVYFNSPPLYSKGIIRLPEELERIVSLQENIAFKPSYKVKTIVVDPGHGGKDPGAISVSGMKEKDLNLKVAKLLKDDLVMKGFRVVLTRDKDIFLSLRERVEISRKVNADLFVSIHANSNRTRSVSGVEFYCLSPSKFDSQKCAESIVKEENLWFSKQLSSDEQAILWDMLLTKNHALSVEFGNRLYSTFKNLGFKPKVPKSASFYVLKCAYVPSVLIEIGYLSNIYDEKSLRRQSYQKQISEAITLGVVSLNDRYTSLVKNRR